MKVVVSEFITLDGVVEEPQNWSFPYWNDEIATFKHDELFASDAHLLGRVTYQGFAAAWPARAGSDDFADRMNSLPKYVVSSSMSDTDLTWEGSHLIGENVAIEVQKLKQQPGNNLLVAGSPSLIQTLIESDLVDDYHLLVYPLALGRGKKLFTDGVEAKLKLVETKQFATGVVLLHYQPATNQEVSTEEVTTEIPNAEL